MSMPNDNDNKIRVIKDVGFFAGSGSPKSDLTIFILEGGIFDEDILTLRSLIKKTTNLANLRELADLDELTSKLKENISIEGLRNLGMDGVEVLKNLGEGGIDSVTNLTKSALGIQREVNYRIIEIYKDNNQKINFREIGKPFTHHHENNNPLKHVVRLDPFS